MNTSLIPIKLQQSCTAHPKVLVFLDDGACVAELWEEFGDVVEEVLGEGIDEKNLAFVQVGVSVEDIGQGTWHSIVMKVWLGILGDAGQLFLQYRHLVELAAEHHGPLGRDTQGSCDVGDVGALDQEARDELDAVDLEDVLVGRIAGEPVDVFEVLCHVSGQDARYY